MTDGPETSPATLPASSVFSDERQLAMIIYILYLVGFATGGVTTIVGLVLAYVNRDGAPDWLRSHYSLQIRTFWIYLLYFSISVICLVVVIGIPMVIAASIWFIVRCALGINHLLNKQAYPTPESWLV